MPAPKTLYELLSVLPDAPQEVIKGAYRALQKKYHPDSGEFTSDEAATALSQLAEAFEVLSSESSRRSYDERIRIQQNGPIRERRTDARPRGRSQRPDVGSTSTTALQHEYWSRLRTVVLDMDSPLIPQKAGHRHWLNVSIGRSGFHLAAIVNTNKNDIGVELHLSGQNAKINFRRLAAAKTEIERELGEPLEWLELPHRTASRILLLRHNSCIREFTQWPEQHIWLAETHVRFDSVFRARIHAFP